MCGWAQDTANPEVPVALIIHADGEPIARTIANAYRADLRAAGLGSGCHAFVCPVPPDLDGAIELRREADGAILPWTEDAKKAAA